MSRWYTEGFTGVSGTLGRARLWDAEFRRVEAGFDALEAEIGAAVSVGNANRLIKVNSVGTSFAPSIVYETGTNVGVGTATPAYKLDVAGIVRGTGGLVSTTNGVPVVISADGSGGYIEAQGSNNLRFLTNGAERVRITNLGDMVIGDGPARADVSISTAATTPTLQTIHMGFSGVDFYGFRTAVDSSPTTSAAGTLRLQRGTTSSWADMLSFDNSGLATFASGITSGTATSTAGGLALLGGASGATLSITPSTVSGASGVAYNAGGVSGGNGPHIFQVGGNEIARFFSGGCVVGQDASSGTYVLRVVAAGADRMRVAPLPAGQGVVVDVTDSGETTTARRLALGGGNGVVNTRGALVVDMTVTPATLNNGQLTFTLPANNVLRIHVRGTDGILRQADIPLL